MAAAPVPPVIACESVQKRFGGTVALAGVSLTVQPGSLYGFLGPNGAGKSTLVKILTGLVSPSAGEVRVLGGRPGEREVQARVGYLPELFRFPGWLTGREVLDFHAKLLGVPSEADALCRLVGLTEAQERRVGQYSKGMQQRLGLAQALVGHPDVIFLDEPTSALDPLGRLEVRDVLLHLKERGTAVFLNSHLLTEVEKVCDQVAVIDRGRIVAEGPTEDLLARSEVDVSVGANHPAARAEALRRLPGASLRRRAPADTGRDRGRRPRHRADSGGDGAARLRGGTRASLPRGDVRGVGGPGRAVGSEAVRRRGLGRRDAVTRRHQVDQVLLLTRLTWKEALRRRTLLLGFLLTAGFILLYGLGAYFAFRHWETWAAADAGRSGGPGAVQGPVSPSLFRDLAAYQMLTFGMFITSFLGAMLVIFAAAGMIGGDVENGTLQTIVTRPIARSQILAGRFLGYATIFLVYLVLLCTSLVVLTRVYTGYTPPAPVATVLLLVLQGVVVLGLVSVASALLSSLTAGIVVFMAYGLSFVGGVVEQIGTFLSSGTAETIGRAVGYLVPTDPVFRMAIHGLLPDLGPLNALQQQMGPLAGVPPRPGLIAYSLLYLVASLAAAVVLFARRDL